MCIAGTLSPHIPHIPHIISVPVKKEHLPTPLVVIQNFTAQISY